MSAMSSVMSRLPFPDRYSASSSNALHQPWSWRIARGHRREDGLAERHPRPVALLGEADGDDGLAAGLAVLDAVPGHGEDEPLGCRDLAIDTTGVVDLAFGRACLDAPGAADAHVRLTGGDGEPARSPPLRELSGVRPGGEDRGARRVEQAADDENPVARLGGLGLSCGGDHAATPRSRSGGGGRASPAGARLRSSRGKGPCMAAPRRRPVQRRGAPSGAPDRPQHCRAPRRTARPCWRRTARVPPRSPPW